MHTWPLLSRVYMLVGRHCSHSNRNYTFEGVLRADKEKYMTQQEHNIIAKSCTFLPNRRFQIGCFLFSYCHLAKLCAVNFMGDVLLAPELISVLCSLPPSHFLSAARLILAVLCFLQTVLKRLHAILLVPKMSKEQI